MRLARANAVVVATILAALIGSVAVASAGRIDLIAELQTPVALPNLVLLTYPSLTDLQDGTNLSQRILPLGDILAAEFDIAGLDIVLSEGSGGGGGSRVPGPHSLALLLASVACAGISARTRKASRGR